LEAPHESSCHTVPEAHLAALSRELLQQCLRLLQVGGIKPLGEPAIDLRQELSGVIAPALLLPQPAQAHRGPQLPRLRLLAASHAKGLLEPGFRFRLFICRQSQQQLSFESIQLRLQETLPSNLRCRLRLGQHAQPLFRLPHVPIRASQQRQTIRPCMCPCGRHHKGARAQLQHLFCIDASGCYPLLSVVRTYAPVGQTPSLRERWTRAQLAALSALSPEGKRSCRSQDPAIDAAAVVACLDHLRRAVAGRIVMIWDGGPRHRRHRSPEFLVHGAAQRLYLARLPASAPELNPGEGLWPQRKGGELRQVCCVNIAQLRVELCDAVQRSRRTPGLLKSFFRGAKL
jgi:putative transposase